MIDLGNIHENENVTVYLEYLVEMPFIRHYTRRNNNRSALFKPQVNQARFLKKCLEIWINLSLKIKI